MLILYNSIVLFVCILLWCCYFSCIECPSLEILHRTAGSGLGACSLESDWCLNCSEFHQCMDIPVIRIASRSHEVRIWMQLFHFYLEVSQRFFYFASLRYSRGAHSNLPIADLSRYWSLSLLSFMYVYLPCVIFLHLILNIQICSLYLSEHFSMYLSRYFSPKNVYYFLALYLLILSMFLHSYEWLHTLTVPGIYFFVYFLSLCLSGLSACLLNEANHWGASSRRFEI